MGIVQERNGGGAVYHQPSSSTCSSSVSVNRNIARGGAPPRPGASGLLGGNVTNSSAHTFSTAPDHSRGLDATTVIAGVVIIILAAILAWLHNRLCRLPDRARRVVEKRNGAADFKMFEALAKPVSKKDWLAARDKNEDTMVVVTTQDICAICLDAVNESNDIRPLPCHHIFHQSCFDKWFWNTHNPYKCPLCRTEFIDWTWFPRAPEESHLAP